MPILAAKRRVPEVSCLRKWYSTNGGETESYQSGKFLSHLSSTLAHLYKLLSKGQVWHWGREQEEALCIAKSP